MPVFLVGVPKPVFLVGVPKPVFLLGVPKPVFLLGLPKPVFLLGLPTPLDLLWPERSSLATLAFLVVLRVLIKLFFSMDIVITRSFKFNTFVYRRHRTTMQAACQTGGRNRVPLAAENNGDSTKVLLA